MPSWTSRVGARLTGRDVSANSSAGPPQGSPREQLPSYGGQLTADADAALGPPPPYAASQGQPPSPSSATSKGNGGHSGQNQAATAETAGNCPEPDARHHPPPPEYRRLYAPSPLRDPAVSHRRPAPRDSEDDRARLEAVLRAHPWHRHWGARPKSLAAALQQAALMGKRALVLALLQAGAQVRMHGALQTTTAVHEALRGPRPELALLLLDHVSESESSSSSSPESSSCGEGNPKEHRAPETLLLSCSDADGCKPLHLAAAAGETEVAAEFLRRGSAVDVPDRHGRTALHMAARYGRGETAACLLRWGADAALVDRMLWVRAGGLATPELGSYGLVRQVLRDAFAVVEGTTGSMSLSGGRSTCGGALSTGDETTSFVPDEENNSSLGPDDADSQGRKTPTGLFGYSRADLAEDIARYRSALRSPSRKPPPSLLLTEEYQQWKRSCEIAQAEHRVRNARDRRAGLG